MLIALSTQRAFADADIQQTNKQTISSKHELDQLVKT